MKYLMFIPVFFAQKPPPYRSLLLSFFIVSTKNIEPFYSDSGYIQVDYYDFSISDNPVEIDSVLLFGLNGETIKKIPIDQEIILQLFKEGHLYKYNDEYEIVKIPPKPKNRRANSPPVANTNYLP